MTAVERAKAMILQDRLKPAEELLRRTLAGQPGNVDALSCMVVLLLRSGSLVQAQHFAERAASLAPADPLVMGNLCAVHYAAGAMEAVVRVAERALRVDPSAASVREKATMALVHLGRFDEAAALAQAHPGGPEGDPVLLMRWATAMSRMGRADEASGPLAAAMDEHPDNVDLAVVACSIAHYHQTDPRKVQALHMRYRQAAVASGAVRRAASPASTGGGSGPDGVLRVGLLSADLRAHPVAHFVEPLLRHLDRSRFSVQCFMIGFEDQVSARLRPLASSWHGLDALGGLSAAQVAQRIGAAGIDVLIELGGHTHASGLPVIMQRAAPVQLGYCGYTHRTGTPNMDGRIVDHLTDPPELDADPADSERLIRLPRCFLCFQPPLPEAVPEPIWPGDGPLVFGCFNDMAKLGPASFDLFAAAMAACPDSRLLFKGTPMERPGLRQWVNENFAARGISAARLELLGRSASHREHLAQYGRVHIGLDPFPYHGTTTTCDALLMGVPVLSLAGETHASRVGLSLLTQVGLSEWCVPSAAAFAAQAARAHLNRAPLRALREHLRSTLLASPLCDGPGFAKAFAAMLLDLHQASGRAGTAADGDARS
jgi:protein O-GlcNAc transferase